MAKSPDAPRQSGAAEIAEPRTRAGLDPPDAEMRKLAVEAIERLIDDQATLSDQRVARRWSSEELARRIDEPLPIEGRGGADTLEFFFDRITPAMTRVNHPRFHAYIPAPGSFYGFLGEVLAAGTNPFAGSWLGAAGFATLELTVLRWISEAIGYPNSAGVLTSGGSIANLTAIAAARARAGERSLDRGVLYFSDQGHHSATKAASVLGFAPRSLSIVQSTAEGQIDLAELERRILSDRKGGLQPLLICANAGTTNTGAIDPLPQLADLSEAHQLWLHVDAAYGGFAAICERGRKLLEGMERADSVTLDPHKWLYVPMGVGCLLCRHREHLESAFYSEGDYLQDVPRDEVNFFDRGPELSRPARALSVWMLMRSVGLERLRGEVEADLELANLAARLIGDEPRFEVLQPPTLSVVIFGHRSQSGEPEEHRGARDRQLVEAALEDGTCMISSTEIANRTVLRFTVLNHRTDEAEVRRSVDKLRELAGSLSVAGSTANTT